MATADEIELAQMTQEHDKRLKLMEHRESALMKRTDLLERRLEVLEEKAGLARAAAEAARKKD